MKKYNIQNYIRYKNDMTYAIAKVEGKFWDEYNRDELIIKFLPFPFLSITKKFICFFEINGKCQIPGLQFIPVCFGTIND